MRPITTHFDIVIKFASDTGEPFTTVGWKAEIGTQLYGRYLEVKPDLKAWQLSTAVTLVVKDMLEAISIPDDLLQLQLTAGVEPQKILKGGNDLFA